MQPKAQPAAPKAKRVRKGGGKRDRGGQAKAAAVEGGDYSVNALSKLTGKDRRTIDKAVAGVVPTRVAGKTKFYRLQDVEEALKKPGHSLRDEKLMEEIRKLRIANDKEEGIVVLKSAVMQSVRRCMSPVAAMLEQRLVNEYPTGVAGLDVPQARIYGKRLCDELLTWFQTLEKEWKT
jgi:hypothetical protein